MNNPLLVAELCSTVRELCKEAKGGDELARSWLVESFPGHIDFLLASWAQVDERDLQIQRRRNHAVQR